MALELAVPPANKKQPAKPSYVTVVMKRGKKERIENTDQKIKYVPLSYETDEQLIVENSVMYSKIIE